MEIKSLDRFITSNPGTLFGKPCIAGHRISVAMIACWHLEMKQSVDEIVRDYDLTHVEVYAALAYYFDHRDEIDRRTTQSQAKLEELKALYPSRLQEKLKKNAS